ncbi:hypothetical protein BCR33DRAFT_715098 [Rhizoclosmatium globosum]|uniref:Uncharacterized protein n=1 Tax=Rhizoclosmatium globosum TaxID=329046 RepID=A0A1Y2CK81_9FUNG|nr:hypothetical protein BCR33DRAFT_715098 [Rhizoclosmatium globosum]|eukprot:ORY47367.1 hypothetical protein BCR33DRAFT_715098 [Rhizoclosmatium globosum]
MFVASTTFSDSGCNNPIQYKVASVPGDCNTATFQSCVGTSGIWSTSQCAQQSDLDMAKVGQTVKTLFGTRPYIVANQFTEFTCTTSAVTIGGIALGVCLLDSMFGKNISITTAEGKAGVSNLVIATCGIPPSTKNTTFPLDGGCQKAFLANAYLGLNGPLNYGITVSRDVRMGAWSAFAAVLSAIFLV